MVFWKRKRDKRGHECGGGLACVCVRMWLENRSLPAICILCSPPLDVGGWLEVAHIHCSSSSSSRRRRRGDGRQQPALGLGALTLAPLTRGRMGPPPPQTPPNPPPPLSLLIESSRRSQYVGMSSNGIVSATRVADAAVRRWLLAVHTDHHTAFPLVEDSPLPQSLPSHSFNLIAFHINEAGSWEADLTPSSFGRSFYFHLTHITRLVKSTHAYGSVSARREFYLFRITFSLK